MAAPGAPTSVIATAGYQYAAVEWQPPTTGGAVTSYVITCCDGAIRTVTIPAGGVSPPPYVSFGSRVNGVALTFTVVARNVDGDSDPAETVVSVLPELMPGQMPNVIYGIMGQIADDFYLSNVGNPPEMHFGGQYIAEESDGPQVIFVPKGGPWRGPLHDGNGYDDPVELWTRRPIVQAHIWGVQLDTGDKEKDAASNYGVAELLMTRVAAAVQRIAPGSQITEGERWTPANAGNIARGATVLLDITLELPSVDYLPPIATITSTPQTVEFS